MASIPTNGRSLSVHSRFLGIDPQVFQTCLVQINRVEPATHRLTSIASTAKVSLP